MSSIMSIDDRGGYVNLEQKMFNTGPQAAKALPLTQSANSGSLSNQGHPNEQQAMATGDTGHVGNVTYMNPGMIGANSHNQYMTNQAHFQHLHTPSTSMMTQQNGSSSMVSRSSPTTDMNQCLQPVSEDSIDGVLRELTPGGHTPSHHMHQHHQQMQQQHQHHMQQQQYMHMGPPTSSYHNSQPHMQQMHHHQQYQQQNQHHMYAPQMTSSTQAASMQHVNESSNLSSAGSISDREPDQGGTPQRPVQPQSTSTAEKKSVRKRRRIGTDEQATPKQDKKITEFLKLNQASPKRFLASSNGANGQQQQQVQQQQQNGSSSYGNQDHPHDIHSGYWGNHGVNNRATPTPQQPQQLYSSSDSSSNSNQSPPGQNNHMGHRMIRTIDTETQTDTRPLSLRQDDEIARRDRINDDLRRQNDELQREMAAVRKKMEVSKDTIRKLLIEKNIPEREAIANKTEADTLRIGCFKTIRRGDSFKDEWATGSAYKDLQKKTNQLDARKKDIVNASALLKKRKPIGIGKEGTKRAAANSLTAQLEQSSGQPSTSCSADDAIFRRPEEPKEIDYDEYIELEEVYKLRREHLKKDEGDLIIEKEKLEREKQLHIRELKRAANESSSPYKEHVLLNNRYLMLSLLGKGGFSEVWKAFDLEDNRYVACKIHHVNKDWKEEKKANYVKHAMREKDIHKSLDHCRIVKLFDLFTIDNHSFCTVLEYCPGNDLDFYLKQNKQISEKEAKSVIKQVVSALVYLNEKRDPIIHYDLKPANILLESGDACGTIKITDFGLSKIMEGESSNDDHYGIELTSQFAGTYWYLPPETFVVPPPKITCKVDVWSIGVIFYQCIYGKKPFGDDLTQQKILENNTIINARDVPFPVKPQVSPVAQDFIRRCLQYNKEDRADVFELAKHELFRTRGAGRTAAAGSINSPIIPRSPSINREDDI